MTYRNAIKLLMALAVLSPATVGACEPIVPLVQVFGGPNLFARTSFWMLGAVVVKCIAFVFFERGLRWYEAIGFMALANVLSTEVGILVGMIFAAPMTALFVLPVALLVAAIPARRLVANAIWPALKLKSAAHFTGAIFLAMLVTMVLWGLSQAVMDQNKYFTYWLLKYAYVVIALFISIVLTSVWEEWAVAGLAKYQYGEKGFMKSVLRSNYVTFAVVVTATAIEMLPRRMHNPGFLFVWLQNLSAWLGGAA